MLLKLRAHVLNEPVQLFFALIVRRIVIAFQISCCERHSAHSAAYLSHFAETGSERAGYLCRLFNGHAKHIRERCEYRLTAIIPFSEQFFCFIRSIHYETFFATFFMMKYEKVISKA